MDMAVKNGAILEDLPEIRNWRSGIMQFKPPTEFCYILNCLRPGYWTCFDCKRPFCGKSECAAPMYRQDWPNILCINCYQKREMAIKV